MKIVVSGDHRNWYDRQRIKEILQQYPCDTVVIEGEAKGVDTLAKIVAEELGMIVYPVPADWKTLGRRAGPIRNSKMLKMQPDIVIGFHNNIKKSLGTKDCLKKAIKQNLSVILVTSDNIIQGKDIVFD